MRRSIRAIVAVAAIGSVALATGIGVALATGDNEGSARRAVAVLADANGQKVGVAVLKERHGKVEVSAEISGVPAGFHGFHVHAVGECVPPFTSAGGHFNPAGVPHGDHAGDMPSLLVNQDGTAELEFETDRFSLGDLFDADGSAVIVHAGRDNFANIPSRYHSHTYDTFGPDVDTLATGDAGSRAACGVVERSRRGGDSEDD
jgi:superoxide dismutase, Cu-Zn family